MSIVVEVPDEILVGLEEPQPACTCRPEYVYRKGGTRLDRHRIDPFCPFHGRHFRREIASSYCRAFNRRKFFSNFIVHLGVAEDPGLESWVKEYVRSLIKKHFDNNAVIKSVLHPKKADRHLHFGVGSDVGHVTLAMLMNAKSPRGRKPRLDLSRAWVDGYRRDQIWNWCAYTLRIDEPWRLDEPVKGQARRRWRSRAEKGEKIAAPTFTGKDGANDVVVAVEEVPADIFAEGDHGDEGRHQGKNDVSVIGSEKPDAQVNWPYWCLVPALRWMARKWLVCQQRSGSSSRWLNSGGVGVKLTQDGKVEGQRAATRRAAPQARSPPNVARSPPPEEVSQAGCMTPRTSGSIWQGRVSGPGVALNRWPERAGLLVGAAPIWYACSWGGRLLDFCSRRRPKELQVPRRVGRWFRSALMGERDKRYVTDAATTKRMSAVRPLDTTPERAVRSFLTQLKYRYRLHRHDLPGRPDIVFPGRRKVVFVHGCYWHRHEGCPRTTTPRRNSPLWEEKFRLTVDRDLRNRQLLSDLGWQSFVIWECQTRDLESLRAALAAFLDGMRLQA